MQLLNQLFKVRCRSKNADIICYMLTYIFICNKKMSKNPKKMIKLVNTVEENFHIFQTTSEISMKCSGIMCLLIILKVTKKQGLPPI